VPGDDCRASTTSGRRDHQQDPRTRLTSVKDHPAAQIRIVGSNPSLSTISNI
jgi:hypothetical protein